MNVLTIIALVIMGFCTLRGFRRGFVMLLYGVAAWVFIAVFVLIAHQIIFNIYMGNEQIYGKVFDFTRPYVNKYMPTSTLDDIDAKDAVSKITDSLPQGVDLDNIPLSEVDLDKLEDAGISIPNEYKGAVEEAVSGVSEGAQTVGEIVGQLKEAAQDEGQSLRGAAVDLTTKSVVGYLMRVAAVLTAYLIAKIICVIVKIVLIVITDREPFRLAVHLIGAALGWFESVLYIWIGLYAIHALSVTDFGRSLAAQVQESSLLISLDNANMLTGFLSFLFRL